MTPLGAVVEVVVDEDDPPDNDKTDCADGEAARGTPDSIGLPPAAVPAVLLIVAADEDNAAKLAALRAAMAGGYPCGNSADTVECPPAAARCAKCAFSSKLWPIGA